jgi:hypothetical protein
LLCFEEKARESQTPVPPATTPGPPAT